MYLYTKAKDKNAQLYMASLILHTQTKDEHEAW